MKITFLGTCSGTPRPDRFCTGLMVEVEGEIYLIDGGAPVFELLLRQGKEMADVKAVFTTHAHGDHVNGLLTLIDLVHWKYREHCLDVYMTEQRVADALCEVVAATHVAEQISERVRMHIAQSGVVFDNGALRVTYIPTAHILPRPSYAILLEAQGKRVLVTGDLSKKLEGGDFPAIVSQEPLDAVITELAHFGVKELEPYLETCRAGQVWVTHVAPEKKYEKIAQIGDRYGYPVYIAKDGDAFEV